MHFPNADTSLREATMKTFQREANILATLSHTAIPTIHDFFDQADRAYLVMEYINGSDLEAILQKTKELPADKILEWGIDLCDVLGYLHSQLPEPIIFRDMKPANIMIDSQGHVRLIDFGIAKKFDSTVKKHTMIGTEGYSAPEQYKGNVSPLSDIYSLGATLHHVITRKDPRIEPPFTFNERLLKDFNENIPNGLQEIIDKATSFEPEARYQGCLEMKDALENIKFGSLRGVSSVAHSDDGPSDGTHFFDDLDERGEIEPRWKFTTEDEIRSSPVVYQDLALVGSYDTNVWAIELDTGSLKWRYATHGGIASSPVVDIHNKLIMFGSEDNTFYALDTRGNISWTYASKGKIRGTARVAHDHVFFGSDDGHLYALVASNGRYLWEYDAGSPVRSRPFVTNDLVVVGAEGGDVVALELNGSRKWSFRARRGVTSSPYVDSKEGVCYVGSSDNYMYSVDASSGYSLWRFRTSGPILSSPSLVEDMLFFGSADGSMYAINAETSKEKWKFTTEKPIVASPLVYNGAVYFGGTDGYFYSLDAITGRERWKFQAEAGITSSACIANNVILFGSIDRTLYSLPLVE
jgi:outer membrane protein assembly factor BamB